MLPLPREKLEPLRDRLRARGQRPSIVMPLAGTSTELIDALRLVEEWGPFVEAMYLMMAADRRVLNVEREVLRGALAILSNDAVRTRHMEAMLDAAMRKVAKEGTEARIAVVIASLKEDPARAETAVIVAAAVAAADDRVVPEEHVLLTRLCEGLGVDEARADEILGVLLREVGTMAG
jgi:tellurite resistance protein